MASSIELMEIDINDMKKLISHLKNEHAELEKIINPLIEKYDLPKKEILEVCQTGKFIYKVDLEIRITEKPKPPNPDFIIEYNSKLIGLEHTRIFTDNADNYNRIISLIDFSEKIYVSQFPNENVHAIISIKDDDINYKQIEKREFATAIANYVNNLSKGLDIDKPSFISNIRTSKHSKVSFSYNEKNWEGPYLTKKRLEIEIKKKEQKIANYKKGNSELTEYWLVLLIGALSSASYILDENVNYETASEFDRVYLMTDFSAEIIIIK